LLVHQSLNTVLALAVVAHVGAALKHQWVDRDGCSLGCRGESDDAIPASARGRGSLAASCAFAQAVLYDKSEIRFVSKQMGVDVEGRFRKWKCAVDFRPDALGQSRADFDIELASIDLASEESETELKRKDWFDTPRFPLATFRSSSVKSLAGTLRDCRQAFDQRNGPRRHDPGSGAQGRGGQLGGRRAVCREAPGLRHRFRAVVRSVGRRDDVLVRVRIVLARAG
jgi:polyisoprenoid-binding protein YceI